MESGVPDILNVSVVFAGVELMNMPDARGNLSSALNDAEILTEEVGFSLPVVEGAPSAARRYVLERDRISIEVTTGRSSIQKDYPSPTTPSDDFDRLAEIVTHALINTDFEEQELSAYGYNMVIVFNPDWQQPAIQYLGEHLFSPTAYIKDGWQREGGYGSLLFTDDQKRRWTFLLEPRPRNNTTSKRLYIAVNLHIPDTEPPNQESISGALDESLRNSTDFVEQLLRADG